MTRKIILLLCGLGILFYAYKIYHLKDSINLFPSANNTTVKSQGAGKSTPMMRLKFTLETDKVELVEACRKLFMQTDDLVKLSHHPKEEGKAILTIERLFPTGELQSTLDLNKALKAQGCLTTDKDIFALETVK